MNNYPKIAPDFGSDSRRGKGRIIVLCNPCRNTEAGPKDKQDWMIICFRGPSADRSGIADVISDVQRAAGFHDESEADLVKGPEYHQ